MLAGCGHDITQLDNMKENAKAGNHAANAAMDVTCTEGESCAQSRLIKGDACYRQATESSRSNTSADMVKRQESYGCTITNSDQALKLNPPETGPVGDLCTYRLKRLEALNQRSELKSKEAEDYKMDCPKDEAGYYYYSATAIIADLQIQDPPQPQFCDDLKKVDELVRNGQAIRQSTYSFNLRQNDISALRSKGNCT
jgi:hypothetical protein